MRRFSCHLVPVAIRGGGYINAFAEAHAAISLPLSRAPAAVTVQDKVDGKHVGILKPLSDSLKNDQLPSRLNISSLKSPRPSISHTHKRFTSKTLLRCCIIYFFMDY